VNLQQPVIHQAEIHALPTDMVRSPDRFQDRPAAGPAAWGTRAASPIGPTGRITAL